jgi:hypothetical protein
VSSQVEVAGALHRQWHQLGALLRGQLARVGEGSRTSRHVGFDERRRLVRGVQQRRQPVQRVQYVDQAGRWPGVGEGLESSVDRGAQVKSALKM